MKTSYLTRYLSYIGLVVNITIIVLLWLFTLSLISVSPSLDLVLEAISADIGFFISRSTLDVIVTIIGAIWVIKCIAAYEIKVVQFSQDDHLKAILEVLRKRDLSRRDDEMNELKKEMNIYP